MDLLRRMIYLPGGRVPAAGAVDPDLEEVVLTTDDGLALEAWFLSAGASAPGVLMLHGNGGSRAERVPLARSFAQMGLSTLLVDYRGYGGNPGSPHEEGLVADGRAGLAHLRERDDVGDIVYFGESLGAAVSVALAGESAPAAMILRSPFTSLPDVAGAHYPLPRTMLEATLPDRCPSLERIGAMDTPILVIAGDVDTIVPFEQSRRLFDAAPEPKRFVAIDGADHNDLELFTGRRLLDEVSSFLAEHGVVGR